MLGRILAAVGGFAIATALLVQFYAYPKLAVAPVAQNSQTILQGDGATIFDTGTLSEIPADLTTSVQTTGDAEASKKAPDGVVVWESLSSTKSSDGVARSRSVDRFAFDAHTGEAVNCCDEYYETTAGERDPIEHKGLLVKFPFDTQKKTYDWWDSSLGATVPIEYVGTEKIEGLTTYKFEHTIEPTEVSTLEVPASVLQEKGDGNLTAQRMYSNTRTLWVEPNTGVILDREEDQLSTLAYNGEDRVTVTKVTTGYTDETVKDNVKTYEGSAKALAAAKTAPLILGIGGLLALAGGAFLLLRGGRSED